MKTGEKSNHGGARPGAGRKPKLQYEARELFYAAVDARWETILAKLDALIARGDFNTIRWVLEQRVGKAAQSVDITTQGEKISQEPEEAPGESIVAVAREILRMEMLQGMTSEEAIRRVREWARSQRLDGG